MTQLRFILDAILMIFMNLIFRFDLWWTYLSPISVEMFMVGLGCWWYLTLLGDDGYSAGLELRVYVHQVPPLEGTSCNRIFLDCNIFHLILYKS